MLIATMLGYIGPGPGLTMLGALLALLATLGIALWAIALWPYRVLMRKWRQRRGASTDAVGQ